MNKGYLSSAADTKAIVWDINNSKALCTFDDGHDGKPINDVHFSVLEQHLVVTSGDDGFFKIYDMREGNAVVM